MPRTKAKSKVVEEEEVEVEVESSEGEEHHESEFQTIEKLQQLGVNASDITKLKGAGLYTMGKFLIQV